MGGVPLGCHSQGLQRHTGESSPGVAALSSMASAHTFINKHMCCMPGFSVVGEHPPPTKLETDLTRRLAFPVFVYLSNWRGNMTGQTQRHSPHNTGPGLS